MKTFFGFVAVALAFSLSACGGAPAEGDGADTAADAAPAITAIGGDYAFAFAIPEGTSAERLVEIAKTHCGEREDCRVYGWRDAAHVPERLPFTDAQRATLTFEHVINRPQDNFERSLFDCSVYPQADTGSCYDR